jgi:hypothetical protein
MALVFPTVYDHNDLVEEAGDGWTYISIKKIGSGDDPVPEQDPTPIIANHIVRHNGQLVIGDTSRPSNNVSYPSIARRSSSGSWNLLGQPQDFGNYYGLVAAADAVSIELKDIISFNGILYVACSEIPTFTPPFPSSATREQYEKIKIFSYNESSNQWSEETDPNKGLLSTTESSSLFGVKNSYAGLANAYEFKFFTTDDSLHFVWSVFFWENNTYNSSFESFAYISRKGQSSWETPMSAKQKFIDTNDDIYNERIYDNSSFQQFGQKVIISPTFGAAIAYDLIEHTWQEWGKYRLQSTQEAASLSWFGSASLTSSNIFSFNRYGSRDGNGLAIYPSSPFVSRGHNIAGVPGMVFSRFTQTSSQSGTTYNFTNTRQYIYISTGSASTPYGWNVQQILMPEVTTGFFLGFPTINAPQRQMRSAAYFNGKLYIVVAGRNSQMGTTREGIWLFRRDGSSWTMLGGGSARPVDTKPYTSELDTHGNIKLIFLGGQPHILFTFGTVPNNLEGDTLNTMFVIAKTRA